MPTSCLEIGGFLGAPTWGQLEGQGARSALKNMNPKKILNNLIDD